MTRLVSVGEIENHLHELGGGNHADNMAVVRDFPRHYLFTLTEQDFMNLVFLQNKEVSKIAPPDTDRRLKAVAQRAHNLPSSEASLSSNWNISDIVAQFKQSDFREPDFQLRAFLLRDVRSSESSWSPNGWYLQDGSHRALAYCMAILAGEVGYRPQFAYCATSRTLIR